MNIALVYILLYVFSEDDYCFTDITVSSVFTSSTSTLTLTKELLELLIKSGSIGIRISGGCSIRILWDSGNGVSGSMDGQSRLKTPLWALLQIVCHKCKKCFKMINYDDRQTNETKWKILIENVWNLLLDNKLELTGEYTYR